MRFQNQIRGLFVLIALAFLTAGCGNLQSRTALATQQEAERFLDSFFKASGEVAEQRAEALQREDAVQLLKLVGDGQKQRLADLLEFKARKSAEGDWSETVTGAQEWWAYQAMKLRPDSVPLVSLYLRVSSVTTNTLISRVALAGQNTRGASLDNLSLRLASIAEYRRYDLTTALEYTKQALRERDDRLTPKTDHYAYAELMRWGARLAWFLHDSEQCVVFMKEYFGVSEEGPEASARRFVASLGEAALSDPEVGSFLSGYLGE